MKDNQKKTTQKVFIAFSVLLCMLMCAFFVAFVGFELRANASSMDLVFSQEEMQEIEELTRDDTQIYLSHANGNDGNDGSNATSGAIKTINRAIELLPNGGVVNVLDGIQISTSTNISPTNQIILRRTEQSMSAGSGELISITGSNTTVRFDNIVFDGASIDSVDAAKYLITISATTSNVTFGDNVVIENNYTRGVTVSAGNATITTEDLTIRNCNETNGYGFYFDFNSSISTLNLTLNGLSVLNNSSAGQGGVVYLVNGASTKLPNGVLVKNSTFSGNVNTIENTYNETRSLMYFTMSSNLTVLNCNFENNEGRGNGACIYYLDGAKKFNALISGCEFINNDVYRGCAYIPGADSFILEGCKFESNKGGYYACVSANGLYTYIIRNCSSTNDSSASGSFHYDGGFDKQTEFIVENCNFQNFKGPCIDLWEGGQSLLLLKITGCNFENGMQNSNLRSAIRLDYLIEEVIIEDCQFLNFDSGLSSSGAYLYGPCIYINTDIKKFDMTNCVFNNNTNYYPSSQVVGANGGAMNIISSGEYNFTNCKFLNNYSSCAGGAIYIDSSTSATLNATFNNCEFGFNTSGNGGGAICLSEPAAGSENAYYGSVIFNDCYMHDNSDNGGEFGSGAISAVSAGNVTINGGIYERNSAKNGHAGVGYFCNILNAKNAIFRHNSSAGQSGTIWVWNLIADNIDVYGNYAANLGGGLFAGYATISNSNIYDNESGYGGGLYVQYLTMDNCLVENNRAVEAAGIYSITATITNSSISHNEAQTAIGALNIQTPTSTVIDGCKIIGNKAGERIGAIMFGGTTSTAQIIRNCEIRDNVAIGTTSRGIIHSYSYNLVFENVIFSGNQAGTNQGLINMETSSPQTASYILEIIGGEISGNSTLAGGIIHLQSSVQFPSQVRLDGVDIYGNTDEEGAIVQVSENMVCTVIDCSFYSNVGGEKGGAISVANKGSLVISGEISFGSNSATNGGAIYVMSGGEVALSNLNLNNIESTNGIIYTEENSNFNVSGGTIYNNRGENGGVFYINGNSVIQNLEAYNNSATNGGVLYVGETGVVTLDNVNFHNNSATNGGAIYVAGILNFKDGVIDSNSATNGGGVYVGENGSFSMSYDLVVEIIEQSQTQEKILQESYKYGEVINNSADFGGGIYIASNGSASINGGHTNGQNEDENSNIEGAKVSGNLVTNHGGGVYISINGFLSVNGGEFSGNECVSSDITSNGTFVYNAGTMIVNGGKFTDRDGTLNVYGGIYCDDSYLKIDRAIFINNKGHYGTCIYVTADSIVNIENTLFTKNCMYSSSQSQIIEIHSGSVKIDNCYFYDNGINAGFGYLMKINNEGNSRLEISNSKFNNNSVDSLIFSQFNENVKSEKIRLYNCEFDLTATGNDGGQFIFLLASFKEVEIISCQFISDAVQEVGRDTEAGMWINRCQDVEIVDCIFDGYRTNVYIYSSGNSNTTIKDCSFKNNLEVTNVWSYTYGGALDVVATTNTSYVDIEDCEFENNSSTLGASALYLHGDNGQINLSGNIVVQGNTTESAASGAVVIDNSNTVIRKGTLLLIDNNTGGNLVIESGNEGILEGDLEEGSIIGLKFNSPSANSLAVGGVSSSYLMTNSILENFYSENSAWGLKFSSSQNGLIMYDSSPTDSVSVVAQDKVVVKEVGQSYGIVDGDIQVYFGGSLYQGDYTIEYSLTNDSETWVTESPSFSEKGSYTIYYRVTAGSDVVTGSVILNIISERLYISSLPQATLGYGENLGEATIINGLVEDERGQAVSGSWSFVESGVVPVETNSYYEVLFTPYSSNYENSNTLTANINVTIGYDIVFYVNNAFHTDINDINNSYTGLSKLEDMITYMNDGGSIIFTQTYTIDGTENIIANKDINFVRYLEFLTGPMILIESGENNLTLNGGSGTLVFEGTGSLSGTNGFSGVIIDNAGKLELGSNVIIRGFLIAYEIGEDGIYSPIYNRESGVININGAEIYGNTIRTGQDSLGGVIYNLGEINISGGKFFLNNLNTSSSLVEKQGSGGFIYNLGRLTISGGEIFNNHAQYGGAIYIGNGGVAILSGGSITGNRASDAGGAIYVANGGRLVIGSCDISSNFAGNGMNGVEVEENSIVIDSSGNSLVGAGLDLIENLNPDEVIDNKNDIFNWLVPMLIIVAFVLFFTCVLMVKKRRKI